MCRRATPRNLTSCEPIYEEIAGLEEIDAEAQRSFRICLNARRNYVKTIAELTGAQLDDGQRRPGARSDDLSVARMAAAAPNRFRATSPSSWMATAAGRKSAGLPRIKGHEKGAEAVRECVEGCGDLQIEFLTLYAFSAENWQRPKTEVFALMRLLERFLKEKTPELLEKNVRLQAIGRLTDLPESLPAAVAQIDRATSGNNGLTLDPRAQLRRAAGDYRWDQEPAARRSSSGHIDTAMIDVEMFSKHLYTRYYPDPDLLIRTSGEMRLSNFLLWQLSYTEMYVTPKLWPDFTRKICSRPWKNSAGASAVTVPFR